MDAGEWVRQIGSDMKVGEVVLEKGCSLGSAEIGLLVGCSLPHAYAAPHLFKLVSSHILGLKVTDR